MVNDIHTIAVIIRNVYVVCKATLTLNNVLVELSIVMRSTIVVANSHRPECFYFISQR